jgi:hypothetical protein
VDHPQACGCQRVTSEHAAVIKARERRVCLAHAFSRCALQTTWRTIENLEPYAIGRITPDRSLTVAVLNRRQAPPVDACGGATCDPSLDRRYAPRGTPPTSVGFDRNTPAFSTVPAASGGGHVNPRASGGGACEPAHVNRASGGGPSGGAAALLPDRD